MKSYRYCELRFLLDMENEDTHVFIKFLAVNDFDGTEVHWHFKAFDKSMSLVEIARSLANGSDVMNWQRRAP